VIAGVATSIGVESSARQALGCNKKLNYKGKLHTGCCLGLPGGSAMCWAARLGVVYRGARASGLYSWRIR
jgi:nicotinamidase-related amidase